MRHFSYIFHSLSRIFSHIDRKMLDRSFVFVDLNTRAQGRYFTSNGINLIVSWVHGKYTREDDGINSLARISRRLTLGMHFLAVSGGPRKKKRSEIAATSSRDYFR